MKTIRKAIEIIDHIVCRNGKPVTPGNLSKYYGINASTCVRILATLEDCGYVEKVSRKSGYILGPAMTISFSQRGKYNDIVHASEASLVEFVREFNCMINVSVMHNFKRYILSYHGEVAGLEIVPNTPERWNYHENATERLLLAFMNKDDRQTMITRNSLPPGVNSMDDLNQELDRYYKKGSTKFWSDTQAHWIGGCASSIPQYPTIAIGFAINPEDKLDRAIKYGSEITLPKIKQNLMNKQYYHFI